MKYSTPSLNLQDLTPIELLTFGQNVVTALKGLPTAGVLTEQAVFLKRLVEQLEGEICQRSTHSFEEILEDFSEVFAAIHHNLCWRARVDGRFSVAAEQLQTLEQEVKWVFSEVPTSIPEEEELLPA